MSQQMPDKIRMQHASLPGIKYSEHQVAPLRKTAKKNIQHKRQPLIMRNPLVAILIHEIDDARAEDACEAEVFADAPEGQVLGLAVLEERYEYVA